MHLAFGELGVDDEADVLHRDEFVHGDKAGFGIDGNVGHLDAADSGGVETFRAALIVEAFFLDLIDTEFGAGGFPRQTLGGVAFDLDFAIDSDEVFRCGLERRGDDFEQFDKSVDGGFAGGGGDSADRGGTAGRAGIGIAIAAEVELDGFHGQAEGFGGYLGDDGAGADAEILRADLNNGGAIGVNGCFAVACVTAAAPGADCEAEAAFDGAGGSAARLPVLLPIHQLGGFGELVFVSVGAGCELGVLEEELDRVHVEFGREIFKRGTGEERGLRVVWRAPGALGASVGFD